MRQYFTVCVALADMSMHAFDFQAALVAPGDRLEDRQPTNGLNCAPSYHSENGWRNNHNQFHFEPIEVHSEHGASLISTLGQEYKRDAVGYN